MFFNFAKMLLFIECIHVNYSPAVVLFLILLFSECNTLRPNEKQNGSKAHQNSQHVNIKKCQWGYWRCADQHYVISRPLHCRWRCQFVSTLCTEFPETSVLMQSLWLPHVAACKQCSIMRVSASLWLHGSILVKSVTCNPDDLMPSSWVITTVLPAMLTSVSARKWNNSLLLLSTRRNSCQFEGTLPPTVTFAHEPLPHFSRVSLHCPDNTHQIQHWSVVLCSELTVGKEESYCACSHWKYSHTLDSAFARQQPHQECNTVSHVSYIMCTV